MSSTSYDTLCELMTDAARAGIMQKAVLSKAQDPSIAKAVLTLRRIGKDVMLQLETFRTADVAEVAGKGKPLQASHQNIPLDKQLLDTLCSICQGFHQINLLTSAGNCEYRVSKKGKTTLMGATPIRTTLSSPSPMPIKLPIAGNDKQKNYILNGQEQFLQDLGISDARGRVHDKKQPKFRQINRFLELIRDIESHLPKEGTLNICDLCCGKSYLSFAVYHYFTEIKQRNIRMVGVDMKAEVIDDCNAIAQKLGMTGLSFVCADVTKYEFGEPVHMVISLHACDVATDIVIDKAISWGVNVILSTPCCHHDLNQHLNCNPLDFIAKHSMLRQKFCDAATDALRLLRMEANGYDVCAMELIDPEETPKNIMLRGIKKYAPSSERCRSAQQAYESASAFLLGQAHKE